MAPFKVGPDYIDPGYHTLAAGRPGRNLDPVLVGEDRIAPLARHGAAGAEMAVVEGVMGLFDGRLADGHGSTAQVAALLGAPVVLVVDCRGQSRSLAALLHGFRSFDPDQRRLAGVVLNRVGSARHEQVLRAASDEVGLPVLGALPRRDELAVPSRHLGLVTAAEHGSAATAAVDAMAELVAAHVDLDAVVRLAEPLPPGPAWDRRRSRRGAAPDGSNAAFARRVRGRAASSPRPVVAVAGGPAFTFGYAEHVELLAAAGPRSPSSTRCATRPCPPAPRRWCCPAGSPRSTSPRWRRTRRCAPPSPRSPRPGRRCTPSAAGCSTCAPTSTAHPMCGVLPATAAMTGRLTLGYRDAVALAGLARCSRPGSGSPGTSSTTAR